MEQRRVLNPINCGFIRVILLCMSNTGMKDTPAKKESIWSLPYIVLMGVNFFQSMAAFMANTTIPLFADHLGASTAFVGAVVSSFAITALLIRPFAGPAFDSFSRKRLLFIAQCIICASLVSYGVVNSLPALVAVRLLHGIGIGCAGPLGMSLVSEFLPVSRFASGISIYALAQSFAQVIGPAVGLFLVEELGFSGAYFLAAGCLLIAMCGIFAVKEPPRHKLPYEFKVSRMFAREALDKALALSAGQLAEFGAESRKIAEKDLGKDAFSRRYSSGCCSSRLRTLRSPARPICPGCSWRPCSGQLDLDAAHP